MKRKFFHIPFFVYKADTAAGGGTPEAPKTPEAPPSSDITRDNADAEKNLKNAAQQPPETPNKPPIAPDETATRTQEEQDRINAVVPASGEEDRRDFRVRKATPVVTNAPQATPRKVVKIDGDGNPVPSAQDAPPAPQSQEKKKQIPRFGPQGRIHTSDNPPETQATTPLQPPSQDPDTEYRTYHRPDGTQERVSRRFGGPWRTGNGKGIIGQDDKIRPETPEPPKPELTPPTPPKPETDKKRPFKPVETSKPAPTPEQLTQRAHPTERENFNKLDFSGTTNPETTQGNAPSENTTTQPAPTNEENKEPPKPITPEKNQSNRTFEEESADFQTRMERGEYHINNQFTDAGREHLRRVDALRPAAPATPGTEEKDKKIPEAQPSTGDTKETPAQPSSATEASKNTPSIKNEPPLPADIEQGNEAVITVNGSSIPLTRESPDAAWRDRDGVPYGDALVAGSMKKDNAEKTQETKTASVHAKPPVPETPTAQPAVSPISTNNTPIPPENSPDTNTPTTPSAPKAPATPTSSPRTSKIPRIRIGGFGPGSPEEKEYLAKEKNFSENINNGSYVQPNSTGEKELTPQGRQVFRELIATEHDYLPSAAFNDSTAGQGLPTDPEDQEKALIAQEKLFLQNQNKHQKLKDVESERTIVTATRSSRAQANPLNGGEQTINFRADRVEVASPDENPRTVKDWLDWKPKTRTVKKQQEISKTDGDDMPSEKQTAENTDTEKREVKKSKTGKIEETEVEEIIPDRPSIYVYSDEEDALGNPRFSGRVLHPSQVLESEGRYDNLYTANMDIDGDGVAEEVRIVPVAKRANGYAHSLGRGDAAVGPSQPAVLIPKKPEKKEEPKPPKLPEIPYS